MLKHCEYCKNPLLNETDTTVSWYLRHDMTIWQGPLLLHEKCAAIVAKAEDIIKDTKFISMKALLTREFSKAQRPPMPDDIWEDILNELGFLIAFWKSGFDAGYSENFPLPQKIFTH